MKSISAFLITCLLILGAQDASSLDLDNIAFVPDPGNPALTYTGVNDDFDATRVFDPYIVKVDDTYYMYYSGLRFGNQMQIGLATSLDGVNWTRSAANPVVKNSDQFWSGFRVLGPKVIYDTDENPPLWKMWYSGNNQNLNARSFIGYATSPDGVNWTPDGSNPVFPPTPQIDLRVQGLIKESGQYRMYYTSKDINSLNLATSDDGLNWSLTRRTRFAQASAPMLSTRLMLTMCYLKRVLLVNPAMASHLSFPRRRYYRPKNQSRWISSIPRGLWWKGMTCRFGIPKI